MSNVGRNQPCPCGSGKKYKRCHGLNQPATRRPEVTRIGPRWIQSNSDRLLTLALEYAQEQGEAPTFTESDPLARYQWLTAPDVTSAHASLDLDQAVNAEQATRELEGPLEPQELGGDAEVDIDSATLSEINTEDTDHATLSPALRAVNLPATDRRERRIFAQLKICLSNSVFEPFAVLEVLRGSGLKLRGVCSGRVLQINQPNDAALLEPMEWIYGRVVVFERRPYLLTGWEKLPFRRRKPLRAALETTLNLGSEEALHTLRLRAQELLTLCKIHSSILEISQGKTTEENS